MILNPPLILFQARESEIPSWNTLQICANLRPPHTPVVATICPVSFTIVCFYAASPLPTPLPQSETTSVYRRTDRHLLQAVNFDRGGCNWLCIIDPHDSWNVLVHYHIHLAQPLGHCCHLFPYRIHATFLQMADIIISYPLWITIRKEYYTSFQMRPWCLSKISITGSCHCLKPSSYQLQCYDLLSFKSSRYLHETTSF